VQLIIEFVQLWKIVQQVNLTPHIQDEICWEFNESGQFSTNSAYHAQFQRGNEHQLQPDHLVGLGTTKMQIL